MNVINFQPFDYTYGLNNLRSQNEKLMDSVNQNLSQGIANYDTWAKEKKKWDAMMEDQAYFKGLHDNAIAGRDKYNESMARQAELQKQIDETNGQIDEYMPKYNRIQNSMTQRYSDGSLNYDPRKGQGSVWDTVYGRQEDGSENPNYGTPNNGAWRTAVFNPYENKIKSLSSNLSSLQTQLDAEKKNGAQYENDFNNAAMYEDPRFAVALRKTRTDMDPSAVYNYMSAWQGEGSTRDAKRLQASNVQTMENMKSIIGQNFSDADFAKYGRNAQIAYYGMMNANDPSTFNSYLGMFNNIVNSKDATDRMYGETRKSEKDIAEYAIQDFETSMLKANMKDDPTAKAQLENMKARYKAKYGEDYDSSTNVGLVAGQNQEAENEAVKLEKKRASQIKYRDTLRTVQNDVVKSILSSNPSANLNDSYWRGYIQRQIKIRMEKKGYKYNE